MTTTTTPSSLALVPSLKAAWQDVDSSFERFCLTAGIGAMERMLCEDAQQLAGDPHRHGGSRIGQRWARLRARSISVVAGLPCVAHGFAATTAMSLRCRLGPRA